MNVTLVSRTFSLLELCINSKKSTDYFVITFVTPNRSLSPLSKKILIPLFFNEQYQAGSNTTKFL